MIAEMTLAALAGGLAGLLAVAAVDPRSQISAVDSVAILTGALVGVGLDRFLRS